MLNIDFNPVFTRTASFEIPSAAGFDEQSCEVTFNALTIEEFAAIDLGKPDEVKRFLARVIVDLADVVDGKGEPVPYSPELRDRLINQDWGRRGLVHAYIKGRQKAAEGN